MISFERIIELLRAKPMVGGLEISDTALRFAVAAPGALRVASVRLAPGILEGGQIKDETAFQEALSELRSRIVGKKARSSLKINVVAVLSSSHIYSQVFDLPYLEGESLERAAALNIKMAAPSPTTYAGWQVVDVAKDRLRMSVLAAFLEQSIAESMTQALRAAGFSPVAIESKSMALARLAKYAAGDNKKPAVVVAGDADGLDIIVMRNGALHFDYFRSWRELQGDNKELTVPMFQEMVMRNLAQVMNYYSAHWKEPLEEIIVTATGLKDEIAGAIESQSGMKVKDLSPFFSPPPTSEWFIALGGALRGRVPRREDREASLLGIDAQETFRREQVEHFLGFWRVLVPSALALLVVVFLGAQTLLASIHRSIASQELFRIAGEQSKEIESLKNEAMEFNRAVTVLEAAEGSSFRKSAILATVLDIAVRRSITVNRLTLQGPTTPIILVGNATKESDIREFKNELGVTQRFKEVNLPLTEIRKSGENYTFSISFLATP